MSLSATRIAYEFAGTGVSRDLTIQSTGNLILSAGGSLSFSQSLPTSFAGLQANAPASNTSSHFRVLSSNGRTLFNISSAGRVAIRGRSTSISDSSMESPTYDLECIGFTQPILFRHLGSNTGFIVDEYGHGLNSDVAGCWLGASGTGARLQLWGGGPLNGVGIGSGTTGFLNVYSNGKVAIGRGSIYASSLTSPPSAHVTIVTDSTMNSYTSDILLLSAGPNVSISNYINCVSAGQTIFSVNSTGQFNTANIAANRISINYAGGFQTTNFLACESPDGYVIGTNNAGGSYHFVSVNNYAANNGNAALASARGQWNFPSVINAPTAFTLNNQIYLLNDTATTQLIGVSSNRATAGFYFYPTSTSFPAAASIYLDSQSFLNLNFQGGGGKSCVIGDGTNISLEARYPGNVSTMNGHWQFNAFNTATNNVTINQTAGQYGTLFRVLSTNSTAMFSVSADGVSRFNNKVFVKPTGLIQFNDISTTTPAIKGTSNTIQARTGDDSQYTYLQGKLQTDQAANVGTFTPNKIS